MKAIEQYFHVVLFIMPYKVVLTLSKSVDETMCDHSNESYWAVLPGTVYYAGQNVQVFLAKKASKWIRPYLRPLKLRMLHGFSSGGTVYYVVLGGSNIYVMYMSINNFFFLQK